MGPPKPIPGGRLLELAELRKRKLPGRDLQRFLCVWLRVERGMASTEIGKILGCSMNTVRLVQKAFIEGGKAALIGERRGGRHWQLMTLEEEERFLSKFIKTAKDASVLVASSIKEALEKALGRPVHKVSVYRMLKRHGWRKVVPRPRHPKQDKEAVEAFKKGASQKGWRKGN